MIVGMPGPVHYERLNAPDRFDVAAAPALIKYRPGRIIVQVDSREMRDAPDFLYALDRLSDDLIAPYRMLAAELPEATLGCQIHRVRRVASGRLLASELVDGIAHVEVPGAIISDDLAAALSVLGTSVGHYLGPR
ncbi:hypothetical protein [Streptosporangium saharense]|uniref:hypothetical protein n=1 Tax=Streptosporangium saharense TaxID=1706840 RepID=UPI003325E3C9